MSLVSVIGSVLVVGGTTVPAQAATITVNSTADNETAADGVCTLREAINNANEAAGADTSGGDCPSGTGGGEDRIGFDPALAGATIVLNGNELLVTEALTVNGPAEADPSGITLDAGGESRIFRVRGSDQGETVTPSAFTVHLEGLKLTGGTDLGGGAMHVTGADLTLGHVLVTGNNGGYVDGGCRVGSGGGFFLASGNATLTDTTVSQNVSCAFDEAHGGGFVVMDGNATLIDSRVADNRAQGYFGRGGGIAVLNGDAILRNSTVSSNGTNGENADGGGLYVESGHLELTDSLVSRNMTEGDGSVGGGLTVNKGTVKIVRSEVRENSTAGGAADGGGLYIDSGQLRMSDSTVSGNVTSGNGSHGGGLSARLSDVVLSDSTVSENGTVFDLVEPGLRAPTGGGLSINGSYLELNGSTVSGNSTRHEGAVGGGLALSGSDAMLVGSTISGNSTIGDQADGGGIFMLGGDPALHVLLVVNTTISGNRVRGIRAGGGGLYVRNTETQEAPEHLVQFNHSTVAFNTAAGGADGVVVFPPDQMGLSNTLFVQADDGERACFTSGDAIAASLATDASCTGTATTLTDIDLGPLADNGGPTPTHPLNPGSVAIDAADVGNCDALSPKVDQRGIPRPFGAACDIGAFEVDGTSADSDLGDAPEPYPTLLADDGAAHVVVPGGPVLGSEVDLELDGLPSTGADGDDDSNVDDEDGVVFTSTIEPGAETTVDVNVTNGPALLNAWIDFNFDGDWDDGGEQIFTDEEVADGSNPGLTFAVPADAATNVATSARFRLDSGGGLSPRGAAPDGEVEDHSVGVGGGHGGGDDGDGDGFPDGEEVSLGLDPNDPDSDADGILDGGDPDPVAIVVSTRPTKDFRARGNKNAMLAILDDVEDKILKGDRDGAIRLSKNLRRKTDGCGSEPDRDDWVIGCVSQGKVLTVLDRMIGNLGTKATAIEK